MIKISVLLQRFKCMPFWHWESSAFVLWPIDWNFMHVIQYKTIDTEFSFKSLQEFVPAKLSFFKETSVNCFLHVQKYPSCTKSYLTHHLLKELSELWSICNGCGLPVGNTYPPGHLVPSLFGNSLCSNQTSFPNMPCLLTTFRLEYASVLSRILLCLILFSCSPIGDRSILKIDGKGLIESITTLWKVQGNPIWVIQVDAFRVVDVENHGHKNGVPFPLPQCTSVW